VVPHHELLPAARELTRRIIRHSPDAIGSIITAATRGLNMAVSEGLQVESEQFARLVGTADLNEGLAAWRERRLPNFAGR
jgi:enoyl-CoA hydratase